MTKRYRIVEQDPNKFGKITYLIEVKGLFRWKPAKYKALVLAGDKLDVWKTYIHQYSIEKCEEIVKHLQNLGVNDFVYSGIKVTYMPGVFGSMLYVADLSKLDGYEADYIYGGDVEDVKKGINRLEIKKPKFVKEY